MNLGIEFQVEDEQGTFTLPSPPPIAPPELVHYYANYGHDGDCSQKSPPPGNDDNEMIETQVSETQFSQSEPIIRKFLKLLVHIVNKIHSNVPNNGIRLSR